MAILWLWTSFISDNSVVFSINNLVIGIVLSQLIGIVFIISFMLFTEDCKREIFLISVSISSSDIVLDFLATAYNLG